jgi:hypothetical protein
MKIVIQPDGSWCYAEDFDNSVDDVMRLEVDDSLDEDDIDLLAFHLTNGSLPVLSANYQDALERP